MTAPKIKKFEQWLFEQEKSENTIDSYMFSVKNYFNYYADLNKTNLIDWKRKLVNVEGKSFKTANNRIAGINSYCEFMGKSDCKIKQYKIQKKLSVDNVISLRQYNKLLQCLKDDNNMRWYLIIKTLGIICMTLHFMTLLCKQKANCFTEDLCFIVILMRLQTADIRSGLPLVMWN